MAQGQGDGDMTTPPPPRRSRGTPPLPGRRPAAAAAARPDTAFIDIDDDMDDCDALFGPGFGNDDTAGGSQPQSSPAMPTDSASPSTANTTSVSKRGRKTTSDVWNDFEQLYKVTREIIGCMPMSYTGSASERRSVCASLAQGVDSEMRFSREDLVGSAFIAFGVTLFVGFFYTAVVSKLLPPYENSLLAAIQNDWYYCLLVPLTLPVIIVAVYLHWLSMKMFKHA
ncbi:hypothetical protein PAHAL_5G024900 [Panicum hallii]|uniref:Uncharacterized protein n=1 Tax=Panicum hallii TaxID=206008 RepID=A0A2T8IIM6_9POAL|nr:hypothetical protein PAHAL_5G024900 [Panicum hallii]PVH37534.1 hypothetical protein PAHAL_5G024900 [Panicum hallii]